MRASARRKKAARKPVTRAKAAPKARAAVALTVVKSEPPLARDGLEWLVERKRLKPDQVRAARHYRQAFRATDGVSLPSCLSALQRVDGSFRDMGAAAVVDIDATRRLRRLRHVVLGGQEDLLLVMDGVVGAGHLLLALAGGDHARSKLLRQALTIGLDLIAMDLTNGPESQAEKPTRRIATA